MTRFPGLDIRGLSTLVSTLVIPILGEILGGASADWGIDASGRVTRVIDGDTFDASSVGRIRLADIDSPEIGTPRAQEATDYLSGLVLGRIVYLDIDIAGGLDRYGRIIAVAYVRIVERI